MWNEEVMLNMPIDPEEEQKEIERRIQLDELRRQVDELKEQMYEHTAIDRSEHRLLEQFDRMFRGRWISEPVAIRMIEIIRDRMERSPHQQMEEKLRAIEAEHYMMKLAKRRFIPAEPDEPAIEFIEEGEMEL